MTERKEFTYPLFNKRGLFVGYTPEQIETMGPKTRERYRAVEASALACQEAEAAEKAAQQAVYDAVAELDAATARLRIVRPPVTPLEAARAMFRQNQNPRRPPNAIVR